MNTLTKKPSMLAAPPICMSKHIPCQIMRTIGARMPEAGGILLGPIGSNDVTDYFFDASAACTGATYTPNHVLLRRMMRDKWLPSGMDFKGFVHSHPQAFDRLSTGDMRYIRRLLEINPDMTMFAAPIVIPEEFRLRAIVVLREQPHIPRFTTLQLF